MVSAPNTLLTARLGDSFYFAKCEIVESLLRRGARVPLGRRTGPPLSEAEDGDSANRDELCKILGPKLGRVLRWRPPLPPAEGRCRSAPEDWVLLGKNRWRRPLTKRSLPGTRPKTTGSVRAPFPTQPSRRDGRPTPPPGGETQRSLRSLALPLASTGATRHSAWAIRARKQSLSARLGKSYPINSSFIGLISS